jgi:homoserine dehydrogenase
VSFLPEKHDTDKRTRLALLGCGTVGSEVARQLLARSDELHIELVAILVRDAARERPGIPRRLLTTSIDRALGQAPEIVIELLGGEDPAAAHIARALAQGIHVITANKTVISRRGHELRDQTHRSGATLLHEGAVAAGVPVHAALAHLRGDRITSIRAVVNGTCNYILGRMEAGLPLPEALAEAQKKGFAEADPAADLSGRDTAEKLCVLAAAAGLAHLHPDDLPREGIEGITPADLAAAARQRCALKLVAEISRSETGAITARVGPALIPLDQPLASLRAEHNGIQIQADLAGAIFLSGPGAGPRATASAILGDLKRLLPERAAHATKPHALAHPAPRRHALHARAMRAITPDAVLDTLHRHGAAATDVLIERHSAAATAVLDEPTATRAAREIAGPGGAALALPVLD